MELVHLYKKENTMTQIFAVVETIVDQDDATNHQATVKSLHYTLRAARCCALDLLENFIAEDLAMEGKVQKDVEEVMQQTYSQLVNEFDYKYYNISIQETSLPEVNKR
jgi:hypothetical protein